MRFVRLPLQNGRGARRRLDSRWREHLRRVWRPMVEELENRCLLAFSIVNSDVFKDATTGELRLVADFNEAVNASTVQAADLVVDSSQTATSVTSLDADTVRFVLPALGAGSHSASISAGSIQSSQGTGLDAFSKTFSVASSSQFSMKHNPRLQPGNAPLAGFAGGNLDRVDILWQTVPGAGGTQDTFSVEYRALGSTTWQSVSLNSDIVTGVENRIVRSASITGLNWNSNYEYRVRHRQADVIVGEYQSTFRTRLAAGDPTPFTFATYGDSADITALSGFRQVQSRINQVNPAFGVLLGDNVYTAGSHPESDARFNPVLNPEAAEWMAGHIDYLGLGNHDVGTSSGLPSEHNFSVPVPVAGVTAPAAPPASERAEHNFSWDFGDVHFLTFDTNSLSDPVRLDGQLKWVLADLAASNARWKIVYGHHPIAGVPDKTENPGDNYYQQIVNRLKAAGVDLFMTGHSHTYSWTYPLTGQINNVATYVNHGQNDFFHAGEGLPQLVSGTGGVEIRSGDYSQFPFVAAGFTSQTPVAARFGFTKVDVSHNMLTLSYIAADNGAVIDSFQIEKEITQTVSFQQGVNGYAGTVDTFLQQASPTTNNSSAASLKVDNDDPAGTGNDAHTLLRFDSIFGSGAGQIPTNVTLRSATLQLQVTNESVDNMNLHRMIAAWSATDTWNSRTNGIQTDGVEAASTPDTSSGETDIGQLSFNVLPSLQAWQANPSTNRGWAFIPTGSDGVDFNSSEGTTKPKLIVSFLQSTPPTAVDLLPASDTGISSTDNITNLDNSSAGKTLQFSVSGTVAGATVTLYRNTTVIGTATASGTTTTVTTNGTVDLSDSSMTITARQTEVSKVESADSPGLTIVVDTATPAAPVLTGITKDTGANNNDRLTSDQNLILSGTAEANSTVTVTRVGVGVIGSATSDGSGNWSFDYTGTTLTEGSHQFTATATDAAGNVSANSTTFTVVVDLNVAIPVYWDGQGVTNDWSEAANWSTNLVPVAEDHLVFDGTSTKNSTLDASFAGTIARLTVNPSYTGTITLNRSLMAGSVVGRLGTMALGGNSLTVGADFSHTAWNSSLSGAGGLTKVGTGSFYFQGSSTYDGPTLINNGSILVSSNNGLGSATGGTTVAGGANARLVFERSVNYTTQEPVTINGSGMNGVGSLVGVGNSTFAGPITLGSASTIGAYPAGYTFTLNGAIDTSGNPLTVRGAGNMILGGAVGGGGGLTKLDPNTVTLSATNSYTGTTTVNAGTLLVAGSTASSATTVNSNGNLGGTGTIGPLTVSGGIVNPGNSIGILSGSTANFSSGGVLRLQINGYGTAGTNYDRLNLSQGLTLGGTAQLSLDLSGLTNTGVVVGPVLYGSRTGTFLSTIELLNNPNGYKPCLTYGSTALDITIVPSDGVCGTWSTLSTNEPGAVGVVSSWEGVATIRSVTVASLDSGIDYAHPDLYQNVWINQREIPAKVRSRLHDVDRDGRITFLDLNHASNQCRSPIIQDLNHNELIDGGDLLLTWSDGRDDDNNGYIDDLIGWDFLNNDNDPLDDGGHGTHAAGVVVQVAPNAKVLPLKFLDASLVGTLANASRALDYALAQNVTISSNGWVPSEFSRAWLDKLTDTAAAGHLFITAAGNGDPAMLDTLRRLKSSQILVVAANDGNGNLASFSNWDDEVVDLSAPGVGVISAIPGGGRAPASGTSVATAYAAGVAAALQGSQPISSRAQLVDAIMLEAQLVTNLTPEIPSRNQLTQLAADVHFSYQHDRESSSSGLLDENSAENLLDELLRRARRRLGPA